MSDVVEKDLPENWGWATFGDVAELLRGVNYKKPDASKEPEIGKLPILRANNIGYGLNFNDLVYVPEKLIKDEQHIKKGDIIIAMSSGSKHLVGKAAQANEDFNGGYGAFCANLRVTSGIEPKYVAYYYSSQDNRRRLSDSSKGSNINNLKREHVLDAPIPIAPLEQQKRIVAKIEELFSHIDAGIEALKKAKQLLKQYRQSVLKAAVTGELTKEWREANKDKLEPSSQLLERILKERRQKWEEQQLEQFKAKGKIPKDDKWKEKFKEPFNEYEESCVLPLEWCWASVDQLGKVQLGRQRSPKNRSDIYPTKYIRAANITQQGLDFTDLMDMEFIPEEFERYVMKENDLVISEASGSPDQVGKPAIWRDDMPICCFQNTVIRHRPYMVVPEYLLVHYKYFYWCQIFSKTAGGVGINHLSAHKFLKMSIALPSLLEQKEIVIKVNERFDGLKRLADDIDIQLMKAEKNKQSILASAFTGNIN